MAQVESGIIQMNVIPSDAAEIVDRAVSANRSAAEQKQINIQHGCSRKSAKGAC